jgi:hypothetical protein
MNWRSSSRVFRPSTSLPFSASLPMSPPAAVIMAGRLSMVCMMAPAGSLRDFSTSAVYVAHRPLFR